MKLKSYPKTKPSGVEWIGDVPEHWEVKRLSYLAMLQSGENITSEMIAEGGDYPVFGGNGFRGYYHKFTHKGHFALVGRQGALCGNVNYARGEFWASEHALVVKPLSKFSVTWMGELLRAMNLGQYSITAAQPGISAEAIRALRIPVPTESEQLAIATYLDRETARIDELVGKKRELIERLKEKRTALISRTVTCGLPADLPPATFAKLEQIAGEKLPLNPQLKPSGIEWLGDVPMHWSARRLKDVGVLRGGAGFPHDEQGLEGEELPFYKVGDLKASLDGRRMTKPEHTISKTTARKLRAAIIPPKSIIYAKIGAALMLNRRRVTFIDCCIDNNMTAYIPDAGRVRCAWAFYWLSILDFGEFLNPGAVPSFSEGYQSVLPIFLPPLPEQRAIAAYLDEETAKLNALIAKVETAIERLQEYRTALITAAVTGKIDVREEVKA